jgi:hypothetical protein
MKLKTGWLRRLNNKLYYPWVLAILAQFSFQASRSAFKPERATRLGKSSNDAVVIIVFFFFFVLMPSQ